MRPMNIGNTQAATLTEVPAGASLEDMALFVATLQLKDFDEQIGDKILHIQQLSKQKDLYQKRLGEVQSMLSQVKPGEDTAYVAGDVSKVDFDGNGNRSEGSRMNGSKFVGWTAATIDSSGITSPYQAVRADGGAAVGTSALALLGKGHGDPDNFGQGDYGTVYKSAHYGSVQERWGGKLVFEGQNAQAHAQKFARDHVPGGQAVQVFKVSKDSLTQEASRLQNQLTDLGSESDVDSLRLQSLLSKRGEAMQMASKVIASDAKKQVYENIGR